MSEPYRWLAQYYDEFFGPLRAPIDASRRRLLKRILPGVSSACDLACGSGTTAIELAKQGIEVYAVDLSPGMCRLTRQKARGLPVKVSTGDMRTFRLSRPVDLITCECDALNHIPSKGDLRAVAKSAARALNPGGYFYFDVNNSLGFIKYWSGTHWEEQPGVIMVMNNGLNRTADRAWSEIDWFIREPGGRNHWRRYQEHVEEICWTEGEIRLALEAAGFGEIECWDAAPFFKNADTRVSPGCRSFYLARKGG